MEEAGCGAQFRAAVQVIQGLPRSGSYRPSYEEMLRFYSYYKQATAGRCQGPRPGFWDPIGRYKWDAWHSLGRMSKEEAMAAYVAEMKKVAQKIIDTVPMDETTEEMFGYFKPLYEVIHDMPRPPEAFFKRKGGSQERTADPSQDDPASSPAPEHTEDALPGEQRNGQHVPGGGLAPAAEALEGSQVTSDSEGDVYCDTLEQMEPEQAGQPLGLSPNGGTGQGERGEGRRLEGRSSAGLAALGSERDLWLAGGERDAGNAPELAQGLLAELDAHVASTVRALQDDMRQVLERLSELEMLASAQAASPWPPTISPRTLLFLVTWPFVTQWLLRRWQGRKR
ncbi:acyl-CoA-binding domain-containing protein 4 isoform X3 [Aptenodytes patagonicus]|uniref:acyl-CoA-binding domain-containing protein 4 isoform X3 n=1 Tax=Aptenodytes patagonicus TaxID=9234 RepID=UPI003F9EF3DD